MCDSRSYSKSCTYEFSLLASQNMDVVLFSSPAVWQQPAYVCDKRKRKPPTCTTSFLFIHHSTNISTPPPLISLAPVEVSTWVVDRSQGDTIEIKWILKSRGIHGATGPRQSDMQIRRNHIMEIPHIPRAAAKGSTVASE